jgi:hypothetical protein
MRIQDVDGDADLWSISAEARTDADAKCQNPHTSDLKSEDLYLVEVS